MVTLPLARFRETVVLPGFPGRSLTSPAPHTACTRVRDLTVTQQLADSSPRTGPLGTHAEVRAVRKGLTSSGFSNPNVQFLIDL